MNDLQKHTPTKAQMKLLEAMVAGWTLISQRTYVSTTWMLHKGFSSRVKAMTGYACLAHGWITKGSEYSIDSATGAKLYRTPYNITDLGRAAIARATSPKF